MTTKRSEKTQTNRLRPKLEIPAGKSKDIEPSRLLLDPRNLRLFEVGTDLADVSAKLLGQKPIQDKLFTTLLNYPLFDVKSLEISIAQNGFLRHEPLIVAPYDAEKFLVLEGNRRLTAIRDLFKQYGTELKGLPSNVRQSLQTVPCFVIEGEMIGASDVRLEEYHKIAEIYIGLRHLMGPKDWEPASRYEFQARLLDDGWTPAEVAARFGRRKYEVDRDLKAQRLYRDLRQFEKRKKIEHTLTYNAFAEAARAPSIMKWLGWSSAKMSFQQKAREESFFYYLISRLETRVGSVSDDGEEETPKESAETIVRRLREMLKLNDSDIDEALEAQDFRTADLLYEERREGDLTKKIGNFIRTLKNANISELEQHSRDSKAKLKQLIDQAQRLLRILDALTNA